MATYIQGLTDYVPDIQGFQPDFGMVQKALSTRQNNYDKGFAAANSAYSRVLNTPLTDDANRNLRDQFAKDALNKLKNISSVDFSIPENVSQAENVFAPLWEDNLLVQDAAATQYAQGELAKGDRLRDSKDEKERDQYSDIAMEWIQRGLKDLRNAGRNPDAYRSLERRPYTPFKDIKKFLSEEAVKQKLEVKWDDPKGVSLISHSGGPETPPQFETWARGMMGSSFKDQLHVTGVVEKERRIENKMRMNPGIDKNQALSLVAEEIQQDLEDNYTRSIIRNTDIKNQLAKKIPELTKDGKNGDEFTNNQLIATMTQLHTVENQLQGINADYKDFTLRRTSDRDNIIENPDWFFERMAKDAVVNSWSNGYAANQKYETKVNPAYTEMAKIDYQNETLKNDRERNRIAAEGNATDARRLSWEMTGKALVDASGNPIAGTGTAYGSSGGSGSSGSSGSGGSGSSENASPTYLAKDGTNVQKINVLDTMYNNQQFYKIAANESIAHHQGLAKVLNLKLGFSDDDVQLYASEMRRISTDPTYKFENPALDVKIKAALKKETGITVTDPTSFNKAIVATAQHYFTKKATETGVHSFWNDDEIRMGFAYVSGTQATNQAIAVGKQTSHIIDLVSRKDSKYNQLFTGAGDDRHVKTAEDIAPDFAAFQIRNPDTNTYYTPKELAQMFVDGALTVHKDDTGSVSKETRSFTGAYGVVTPDTSTARVSIGKKDYPAQNQAATNQITRLATLYGENDHYKKLHDDLNKDVQKYATLYNGMTGQMGAVVSWDLANGDKTYKNTEALLKELGQPSNVQSMYVGNEPVKDMEMHAALTQILNTADKKWIKSVEGQTIGRNGKFTYIVNLYPSSEDDKHEFAGVSYGKIVKATGSRIEIEPSANATGTQIMAQPRNSGNYVYANLMHEKFESDPILNAAGFHFSIIPDKSNPGHSFLNLSHQLKDPKTGIDKPEPIYAGTDVDFNLKSPDVLMAEFQGAFRNHMVLNQQNTLQYKQNQPNKKDLNETRAAYNKMWGTNY